MKKFSVFILLTLLSIGQASHASQSDKARALLESMCNAMASQSYRGTFVYMHDNKVESMKIIRRKDAEGEKEKLISLNGEAREIIRDNNGVKCILPKDQKISWSKVNSESRFPAAIPQNLDKLSKFYEFSLDGEERIAGLNCHIVSLRPKDGYRYGHRLWIDQASSLMVKSDLLDEQGASVEQLMFTQLQPETKIEDSEFESQYDSKNYQHIGSIQDQFRRDTQSLNWQVMSMPLGFDVVSHSQQTKANVPVEHIVLSDGMATVSVFIEPLLKNENFLQGPSRMGAVNAFGALKHEYKVTTVGEVPAATVMQINQNIELQNHGS